MKLRWVPVVLLVLGIVAYSFTVSFAEEAFKRNDLMEFIDKFSLEHKQQFPVVENKTESWSLYYFFSFSMPKTSITRMMEQAEKADMKLVIRGMKNSSMKETVKSVIKLGKAPVDINPLLFKKFGIQKVPAVVFAKGKCDNNSCMIVRENDFFAIYGDVTLDYALDKMIAEEPYLEAKIEPILAKLKGGFFQK